MTPGFYTVTSMVRLEHLTLWSRAYNSQHYCIIISTKFCWTIKTRRFLHTWAKFAIYNWLSVSRLVCVLCSEEQAGDSGEWWEADLDWGRGDDRSGIRRHPWHQTTATVSYHSYHPIYGTHGTRHLQRWRTRGPTLFGPPSNFCDCYFACVTTEALRHSSLSLVVGPTSESWGFNRGGQWM